MNEQEEFKKQIKFGIDNDIRLQYGFLLNLNKYVNGRIFSRYDLIFSMFFPKIVFLKYSENFVKNAKNVYRSTFDFKSTMDIEIERYKGANTYVHNMTDYLDTYLKEDIIGAYVFGSLGTGEETNYSDFDALVILKKNVFEAHEHLCEVALKLNAAQSIMFNFDPLQHHGWHVLTEMDLDFFPEYHFPLELFKFAKSIFPDSDITLRVHIENSSCKTMMPFNRISNNIINLIDKKNYPKNMYQLKSLLSQFMLLPSLYIQMRDERGIYKKFSFQKAKNDFPLEIWSIMDEVTFLRNNWPNKDFLTRRLLIPKSPQIYRFLMKRLSPSIPSRIKESLTNDFYFRMKLLINSMQVNIK